MFDECLFCKIVDGEVPSTKVAETDSLLAFRDINPVAPTHILIIPKKHIEDNLSLGPRDKEMMGEILLMANDLARKEGLDSTGFRLVSNNGMNAGQSVFHVHFHLIGGRVMQWPPG